MKQIFAMLLIGACLSAGSDSKAPEANNVTRQMPKR